MEIRTLIRKGNLLFSSKIEAKKMPSKSTKQPTKHELKTQETRDLLLQAAEQIFVRDGYEKADLAEIARLAGRTKGSIYANFKSKEDIFLALYEDKARHRRALMQDLLSGSSSITGNVAAFRKYFLEFAANDSWGFLLLEFRLYAVRNPGSRQRLQDLHTSLLPKNEESAYTAILGPAIKGKKAIRRTEAVRTAFAMLTSLQLEAKFDPKVVTDEVVQKVASRIFETMFGSSNSPTR